MRCPSHEEIPPKNVVFSLPSCYSSGVSQVARRAPNSADARAARAALLWRLGRGGDAEEAWRGACDVAEGCAKYKDADYVTRIRRWPPAMAEALASFLALTPMA